MSQDSNNNPINGKLQEILGGVEVLQETQKPMQQPVQQPVQSITTVQQPVQQPVQVAPVAPQAPVAPTQGLGGINAMLKGAKESTFENTPEGEYLVAIKNAVFGKTKAEPQRDKITITYTILDGPRANKSHMQTLVLTTSEIDPKTGLQGVNGRNLHELNDIFRYFKKDPTSASFDYEREVELLKGQQLRISVTESEGSQVGKDGKKPIFTNTKLIK